MFYKNLKSMKVCKKIFMNLQEMSGKFWTVYSFVLTRILWSIILTFINYLSGQSVHAISPTLENKGQIIWRLLNFCFPILFFEIQAWFLIWGIVFIKLGGGQVGILEYSIDKVGRTGWDLRIQYLQSWEEDRLGS